ncbi:hypothetical protein [Halobacteriovorax sp.]|uniref:hypothetical protein n=1 Tax=Halobacteriovorax sp. TaxID=2020862 RepID=UPI00356AD62B
MKLFMICAIFLSVMASANAGQKQRPFNDEGPVCEDSCGKQDKRVQDRSTIILTDKKPPFNDEGPGGKKG